MNVGSVNEDYRQYKGGGGMWPMTQMGNTGPKAGFEPTFTATPGLEAEPLDYLGSLMQSTHPCLPVYDEKTAVKEVCLYLHFQSWKLTLLVYIYHL